MDLGILDQSKACTNGDYNFYTFHPRLIPTSTAPRPAQVHALTGEQAQAVWTALGNPDWRPAPRTVSRPCTSTCWWTPNMLVIQLDFGTNPNFQGLPAWLWGTEGTDGLVWATYSAINQRINKIWGSPLGMIKIWKHIVSCYWPLYKYEVVRDFSQEYHIQHFNAIWNLWSFSWHFTQLIDSAQLITRSNTLDLPWLSVQWRSPQVDVRPLPEMKPITFPYYELLW